MRIIDCQAHVDEGIETYDLEVSGRNVIFNSVSSYKANQHLVGKTDSIALIFDFKSNLEFVKHEVNGGKVNALKVHSRVQQLRGDDYRILQRELLTMPKNLPVIVDAFYWGADMDHQPDLRALVELVKSDPKRDWVVAHFGGYEVMKYFVHLRPLKNIHYDLSLSLEYFEDSSLLMDFKKVIRWTDKSRMMFGSDFPDGSPKKQFQILMRLCDELKLTDTERDQIAFANASRLYKSSAQ
jgi:predicted TIM-barrel fold metal-dependent hydrolase